MYKNDPIYFNGQGLTILWIRTYHFPRLVRSLPWEINSWAPPLLQGRIKYVLFGLLYGPIHTEN